MAILGEGNVSATSAPHRMLVKASGTSLASLRRSDLVQCSTRTLLTLLDRQHPSDDDVHHGLMNSRVVAGTRMPSVESLFHAFLLTLDGVRFVGHTHPVAVNQILCSPQAASFAEHRIFPDEIVCCGVASVFVPYTDPGWALATAIRECTLEFISLHHHVPRVILLENHGIITLGRTPQAVLAAMLMAEKAAEIRMGATLLGGPVFLSGTAVARIGGRSDEHHRQRVLNL